MTPPPETPSPETPQPETGSRVLILAPQGRDADVICAALGRFGVRAEIPPAAAPLDATGVAALVLTSEALVPETLEQLNPIIHNQESWSDLPFILLVGNDEQRRRAASLLDPRCNLTILERPMQIATLLTVVRAALRARRRQYEVRDLLQQRAALNEQLEQHAAQLEAANRELESFSYSVSHDLRAPLRSITGFSALLIEDDLSPTQQHYLRRIQANGERMGELIDDLLRLARISRSPLRKCEVSLGAVAQKVVRDLAEQHPERRVQVSLEEMPPAHGDERLLTIVLENLLGNAWKFTARSQTAAVTVGWDAAQRAYFVRDNGAGFDMAHASRLFGAFQRLHPEAEYGGSGVGLATVQRIVQRHGGRVWAEGYPGDGATFYFTLPSAGISG